METETIDMLMAEDPEDLQGPNDPRLLRMVAWLRQNRQRREDNKTRGKRTKPEKAAQQVLSLADLGFKPPVLNIRRRV